MSPDEKEIIYALAFICPPICLALAVLATKWKREINRMRLQLNKALQAGLDTGVSLRELTMLFKLDREAMQTAGLKLEVAESALEVADKLLADLEHNVRTHTYFHDGKKFTKSGSVNALATIWDRSKSKE